MAGNLTRGWTHVNMPSFASTGRREVADVAKVVVGILSRDSY